jgi:hypothetical protein
MTQKRIDGPRVRVIVSLNPVTEETVGHIGRRLGLPMESVISQMVREPRRGRTRC